MKNSKRPITMLGLFAASVTGAVGGASLVTIANAHSDEQRNINHEIESRVLTEDAPCISNGRRGFGIIARRLHDYGITREEVRNYIDEGRTMGEILEIEGIDPAIIKADVRADIEAHFTHKVNSGRITREEMNTKLAEFDASFDEMLNLEIGENFKIMHHGAANIRIPNSGII